METKRRAALVGAGFIAEVHAEALAGAATIGAVVDPAAARAEALARKWNVAKVYASVEALIADGACDTAHVLTPPPLHRPVAEALLRAGIHVLVEKPMAESDADCAAMQAAAAAGGAALHVNQNFVHHPAHAALSQTVTRGELGRLRHVSCLYNMPLRQLGARQFGHWMFDQPRNLLLEQAVHPLSQIVDLLGPVGKVSVLAATPEEPADGISVVTNWLVSLSCAKGTAQLQIALGQSHPVWQITAICDDGVMTADCVHNRLDRREAGPWMDFYESYRSGIAAARTGAWQSRRNALRYALATMKLVPRSDPFFISMRDSIAGFYRDLAAAPETLTGDFGRGLVATCERIAAQAPAARRRPKPRRPGAQAKFDVLVIGGTGFIGSHLVAALRARGDKVAVLARNIANLPAHFSGPGVGLFAGDAGDYDTVRGLAGRARAVVNLAHGGGGANWSAIERAMVGGARSVAEACLDAGCDRLVFVSSIAALYLGDPEAVITAETPPDPQSDRRADYSRAKAMAEREMLRLHRERGLPVVILRPGVVVGEGGPPFHSGIGFYNRERHCLGWNDGRNPLPLVLVEDVAAGILQAMEAPAVLGRTFNLVGDVRLTAREYTAELAKALGRPLTYRPQSLARQQAVELVKWGVKRAIGRRDAPFPPYADLRSRGLVARFDTSIEKRDLGWQPVADRDAFLGRALYVHGR